MEIIKWKKNLTHKQWLEERNKVAGIGQDYCRVGASDISVVSGTNKWKSKRRLFLALVGYHNKSFRNKMTLAGQEMEPRIADLMEKYNVDEEIFFDNRETNTKERRLKKAEFFVVNSKYPHMSASLDFIPYDENCSSPWTGEIYPPYTPFECKNVQEFVYKEWKGSIPLHYYEQVQVQMAMTDTNIAVFMPFLSSYDFYPVEVERNQQMIEHLDHLTGEFAIEVTKGKILKAKLDMSSDPQEIHDLELELESIVPVDVLPDEVELANELMQSGNEVKRVADFSEDESLMSEYIDANETIKVLEGRKNQLKAELIYLAEGYSAIESTLHKAIIRGHNADKKAYFRVSSKI